MSIKNEISLIIPVWNHWRTTSRCIASIIKSDIPIPYKMIVIDDASTDETRTLLKTVSNEGYPIVTIQNSTNLGYLDSANEGLKILDTKYVLMMNNDVVLDKNCIKELLRVYETYPDVGILGATQHMLNWDASNGALKYFHRGDKATIRDHIIVSEIPKHMKDYSIVYCDDVHFACALMSREIVDKVGIFDEQFRPGNYDQEDYCLRVKEIHKQVAICPKAKFLHEGSVSVTDKYQIYYPALDRNRELFFKKWGDKLRNNLV